MSSPTPPQVREPGKEPAGAARAAKSAAELPPDLVKTIQAVLRGDTSPALALPAPESPGNGEGVLTVREALGESASPGKAAWWFLAMNAGDGPLSSGLRYAAVTTVLGEEAGPIASDTRAPGELEKALRAQVIALRDRVQAGASGPREGDGLPLEQGMLAWDVAFARLVEPFGTRGKALARQVRSTSLRRVEGHVRRSLTPAELFRLWLPPAGTPVARFVAALAKVVWLEEVRPRLVRERDKPPALVLPVMRAVTQLHSRTFEQTEQEGQMVIRFEDGGSARAKPSGARDLPTLDADVLSGMVARGLDLLGSLTAHRVLRWEIREGHGRVLRGDPDPRLLSVEGGWSELAELLGVGAKKRDEVHAIVLAQARYEFQLPDGSFGDLVSLNIAPARGQRRGRLTIVLGVALLPDYVHELRAHMGGQPRLAREAQRLVPIVDLPPFVGRPREHGQQATLSMSVVTEMRVRARELSAEGGILLELDRFGALARQAGVPPGVIPALYERWQHDGDDGPAFFKPAGRHRFTLGDAHATARSFLEESGRREQDASDAGRASVAGRVRQGRTGKHSK